jgi:hypothetical protein
MQQHPTAQQVVRAGPCGQHKTLNHNCREHAANNSCSRVETQPTASCKPPSTVGEQADTAGEPMQASETSTKLPTTPTPPHDARNKLLNQPQECRAQVRHRSNTPGTTRCILSSCQYTITGGTAGHTGGPHGPPSACPAHNTTYLVCAGTGCALCKEFTSWVEGRGSSSGSSQPSERTHALHANMPSSTSPLQNRTAAAQSTPEVQH